MLAAGYRIVERNWRCRSGEIDIIAESDSRLVFIEVRTRSFAGRFGTAAESVNYRKQLRVRSTAQVYLRSKNMTQSAVRFDVIAVMLDSDGKLQQYEHYEAAF